VYGYLLLFSESLLELQLQFIQFLFIPPFLLVGLFIVLVGLFLVLVGLFLGLFIGLFPV
jgi:hypothetical protein